MVGVEMRWVPGEDLELRVFFVEIWRHIIRRCHKPVATHGVATKDVDGARLAINIVKLQRERIYCSLQPRPPDSYCSIFRKVSQRFVWDVGDVLFA